MHTTIMQFYKSTEESLVQNMWICLSHILLFTLVKMYLAYNVYPNTLKSKKLGIYVNATYRWSQPAVAAIFPSDRIEVPAIPGRSKLISFLTTHEP